MNFSPGSKFTAQIPMPGIPEVPSTTASSDNVYLGQEVLYMSRRKGGPRVGARGTVKKALKRRALVDMGDWGTWHIPYSFLSIPHQLNQNIISRM